MVQLITLFNVKRLPSRIKLIPVIIYFPFGLILSVIRFFIGIQTVITSNLLRKLYFLRLWVLRCLCTTLGLAVWEEDTQFKDESVPIIVTNNVSIMDSIALHLVTNRTTIGCKKDIPITLRKAFNIREFVVGKSLAPGEFIIVQPEECPTNGKALLKFAAWPGTLSDRIQPAVLKIWRPPFAEFSPGIFGSSFLNDLFWFLVTPLTIITVKYLPVIKRNENESNEEYMNRIGQNIADNLNVPLTKYTATDVVELVQKYQKPRINHSGVPDVDPHLVARVKEVLPNIHPNVIALELAKTRDVDRAIANLLDHPSTSSKPNEPSLEKTKFPKSAQDRQLSFQQRKAQLIETARRRYIEKHAVNVINGS